MLTVCRVSAREVEIDTGDGPVRVHDDDLRAAEALFYAGGEATVAVHGERPDGWLGTVWLDGSEIARALGSGVAS